MYNGSMKYLDDKHKIALQRGSAYNNDMHNTKTVSAPLAPKAYTFISSASPSIPLYGTIKPAYTALPKLLGKQ